MDINKIQEFESYVPVYDENPVFLLDTILSKADYLGKKDKQEIYKAYEFARKWHKGIKRLSGEPYIVHPLRVLEFLMAVKPDVPSAQAALLHDVIEDTEVTYEDVVYHFGEEVADLCEGLEKVSKVRYKGEDRSTETLKKTFLAMARDLRVIIIKMADRVHNIQTLSYHPKKDKRIRIAEETLKVYVPVAKRLGLYVFQGFLENGAFKILEPKEYKRIQSFVMTNYGDVGHFKETGMTRLEELCKTEGVPYRDIKGRLKSPYRIYKKLLKYQTNDISKVMDVLAFRVVSDTVPDCYNMLGVIHKHYTPIFSKMKDYIALPKPNGYKSLHTTVLGMFDFPVEIQVRTPEMDMVADYGVAAHFAYSDYDQPVTVSEKQADWIQKLQGIVQKYTEVENKDDFKDELSIEILDRNIFIYTPKGDIIELPHGSTVLDFAFRVHTDIGLKFKNAIINGRIVPIDHKLKTGDIVDIKTFKNKYTASRGWINFLHTPSAKAKLNRFVRLHEKDEIFKEIREKINERLKKRELPLLDAKQDLITKEYKGEEFERLLYRIRDRQLTITRLIKDIYGEEVDAKFRKQTKTPDKSAEIKEIKGVVVIDEDKIVNYELCPLCKPKAPQRVIAKSDKNGVKVHKLSCEALETINFKKLLEAHWKGQDTMPYILQLCILTEDRPGVLLQILKILDFYGINLADISTSHPEKGRTEVLLDLEFASPSKMHFLLEDLKSRKDLIKIHERKVL